MKFSKFSGETIAELLVYLADNEEFTSLNGIKSFEKQDVKQVFVELAKKLQEEAEAEPVMRKSQVTQKQWGQNTSKVISELSPNEEKELLKSFKID